MHRKRELIPLFMFLGLVAVACGTAATPVSLPTTAPPVTPDITPTKEQPARKVQLETTESLRFNPSKIRVEPGESIEFVITDTSGFPHTFTIADSKTKRKILQDVLIAGNETKSVRVTFPEETGSLYLFCRPHEQAGMIGTIGVGVEASEPPKPGEGYRY